MSIQEAIAAEYERRCYVNPRYSQRAFAAHLGVAPSTLSNILNGQKGVSGVMARRMAERLGFSKEKSDYFCDLADAGYARSARRKEAAKKRIAQTGSKHSHLDLDHFKTVSSWHHWAIAEWPRLKGRSSSPASIARELGIDLTVARDAVERLLRIGMLKNVRGKLVTKSYQVQAEKKDDGIRQFHTSVLDLARQHVLRGDVKSRSVGALVLAFRKQDYQDAVQMIQRFQRDFDDRFACDEGQGDDIYCLATQFFKLQRNERHDESMVGELGD